jgi:pimeloyl-ACP methyl ester carboxylesterase
VFVHGWSCDRTYWNGQLDHLVGRHEVVAIDLAGHRESGVGREAWTMAVFGLDVVAVVERLGLGSAVMVGHSMGGDVIVEAALRLPDRVTGLAWVDVYTSLDDARTREEIQAFLVPFREDFITAARALVRRMSCPVRIPTWSSVWSATYRRRPRRSRSTRWSMPSATTVRSWIPCGS